MKKVIQALLTVFALLSCSPKGESVKTKQEVDFNPTTDVYLDLRIDDVKWSNSEIKILKHDKDGELIYSLKTGTNRSHMARIGDIVYVSVLNRAIDDGNLSLLEIDLARGKVQETGIRLADEFRMSADGAWICYAYNDHLLQLPEYPNLKSYFPVIYLQRMGTSEKYTYDLISEMESRADFAQIENAQGAFIVTYYTDSPVPLGVGQINITSHKFTWIKR